MPMGMYTGTAALGKVWQFLKNVNKELPYDSAILLLGLYPQEMKTHVRTKM